MKKEKIADIELTEDTDIFGRSTIPKVRVGRKELAKILHRQLRKMTLEEFAACLTTPWHEIVEYFDLLNGGKACQRTSLLFNPHRLDTVGGISKLSIYQAIKTKDFASGFARALLFKKKNQGNHNLLYDTIQLGVNGVQYINEFPPHVAQKIAKKCGVRKTSKVLDPCAGWGGRMIGISTICNNYTACEPSTATHAGLIRLSEYITTMRRSFKSTVHMDCFEDVQFKESSFDFAITSPPYYDTEQYCNEETNSMNRYGNFDDWCEGFYLPLIHNTMHFLRPGSTFALNIGSRKWPLNKILRSNCDFPIERVDGFFSGQSGGLGKKGEGETLYLIKKTS